MKQLLPRVCVGCGCTDEQACCVNGDVCYWTAFYSGNRGLCSTCFNDTMACFDDRPVLDPDALHSSLGTAPRIDRRILIEIGPVNLLRLVGLTGLALKNPQVAHAGGNQCKQLLDALIDMTLQIPAEVMGFTLPEPVVEEWRRWRSSEELPLP